MAAHAPKPMLTLLVAAWLIMALAAGLEKSERSRRAADVPRPEIGLATTTTAAARIPQRPTAAAAATGTSLAAQLSVDASPCTPDGHCVCSVKAPAACSADEEYGAILALRERVDEVSALVSGSLLRQLTLNLTLLQSRVDSLQASLQTQSVAVSQSELSFLRAELRLVAALVVQLEANATTQLTVGLRKEIDAIMAAMAAIEAKNPIAVQANLQQEINALRDRVARCKVETTTVGATLFPGDALPFNESYGQCSSGHAIMVGPQVTHRYRDVASWWYKDPRPFNDTVRQQIYEIRAVGNRDASVLSWANYADFASMRAEFLKRPSACAFPIHGRKNVILNNSVYYYEAWSQKTVWKLDLATCKTTRLPISIDSPEFNLYLNRETYVDVNYDETGMYVTYTDAARVGELVIAKVNPETMAITNTWETGRQKSTIANVFFVCGRMYTTDSYTTTHLTGKQFGFDTNTGKEFFVDLDVESRFGSVRQLSYNPRERMIFGYDNQHLVTYQVLFP